MKVKLLDTQMISEGLFNRRMRETKGVIIAEKLSTGELTGYYSLAHASKELDMNKGSISNIISGRGFSYRGYRFYRVVNAKVDNGYAEFDETEFNQIRAEKESQAIYGTEKRRKSRS